MQILGLGRNEVKLCPHNQKWNKLFIEEKKKLLTVLGKDLAIEHVGSTAIPNICAKPIIGILIGIKSFIDENFIIKSLGKIDYEFRNLKRGNKPMLFVKANGENSLFHLHITKINSIQWKRAIGFRNYLINNPKTAKEYENLKMELAHKFKSDRLAYKNGKKKFILDICKRIEG